MCDAPHRVRGQPRTQSCLQLRENVGRHRGAGDGRASEGSIIEGQHALGIARARLNSSGQAAVLTTGARAGATVALDRTS